MPHRTQLQLCRLFCEQMGLNAPEQPLDPAEFRRLVRDLMKELGVERPGRTRTVDAQIVRMFLLMAVHSYQRLSSPLPVDPSHLKKARSVRKDAPGTKSAFAQSRCDEASVCRRAAEVIRRIPPGAEVLVLGDDDGLSPLLVDHFKVTMIDLDPEIVKWIRASDDRVETRQCHVLKTPESYRGRFQAVVADPIRAFEAEWFLDAAKKCLASGGLYFWADHPDWNYAFPALRFKAEESMELLECLENWHSYPARIENEEMENLSSDHRRFLELGRLISLWSNLYVFAFKRRDDHTRS